METFKLKAILAAVEYKSLSKAAEAYSYTPSAFSHMLSAFERELGVQILERSSTGVCLTEEGRSLFPYFKEILEREKKLELALEQIGERNKKQLRIGTYSSIARDFLSGMIKRFNKEHPDIKLYISGVDNLHGWLEEDRADIIFADRSAVGEHEWVPLMEDKCSAVAPLGMIRNRDRLTKEDLYRYPHILIDLGYLQDYFDESEFREVIHLTSEDDLSVINMVRQGLGITVLPDLVLKNNSDGLAVFPLEPEVTRTIGFGYKKQRGKVSEALTQFIRYAKKEKNQRLG